MTDVKRLKKTRNKKRKKKNKYDFLPPELQFTGKKLSNQKV